MQDTFLCLNSCNLPSFAVRKKGSPLLFRASGELRRETTTMTELSCKLTCCTMLKNTFLLRAQTLGARILINCLGTVIQSILPSLILQFIIVKYIIRHFYGLLKVENCKIQTTNTWDISCTCPPKKAAWPAYLTYFLCCRFYLGYSTLD